MAILRVSGNLKNWVTAHLYYIVVLIVMPNIATHPPVTHIIFYKPIYLRALHIKTGLVTAAANFLEVGKEGGVRLMLPHLGLNIIIL